MSYLRIHDEDPNWLLLWWINMRLTSKGRYAVTAILDVAFHSHGKPVSLANISQRQGISLYYLEQLFVLLRKKQIVASVRGPGGGYILGKKKNEITVSSIILAVNELMDSTKCMGKESCNNGDQCLTHTLWRDLSKCINDFLKDITLSELVNKKEIIKIAHRQSVFNCHE